MSVAEGTFVLYSRIEPPLEAGTYRLTATQEFAASTPHRALDATTLPTAALPTHVRVRAPRFALPPDQVLSTFPPANSEGDYGMRLPQIVIKRRTLPWERLLSPDRRGTPWLALVVIAEGEAELKTNQPVAACVTPGITLDGDQDAEVGNYLLVRRSVVDNVFPTRLDVPLLAHAREVDVHDTELMMGDDDGFLAVVIANRLPLPGRDAAGQELPVKYLACLINLEGQFDVLRERAPNPSPTTATAVLSNTVALSLAAWDRVAMGAAPAEGSNTLGRILDAHGGDPLDTRDMLDAMGNPRMLDRTVTPSTASAATPVTGVRNATAAFEAPSQWQRAGSAARTGADVYAEMARPFATIGVLGTGVLIEPTYRFPVLLHWSFSSVGDTTFRSLMEHADSGLLGTVGEGAPGEGAAGTHAAPAGRPPLEVVETGHVGLTTRTRRGDEVRSWYRGPCVPHPTADPPEGRLALAHAADQLRIIIPDGREDVSLAAAFEIGRLLALARPSMIAALLRWRQTHYQAARRQAIWAAQRAFLDEIGVAVPAQFDPRLGTLLGRALASAVATRPATFLGDPRPLVDPGRPLGVDATAARALAVGFAIPEAAFRGDPTRVAGRLRDVPVQVAERVPASLAAARGAAELTRAALTAVLDDHLTRLALDTFASAVRAPAHRPPVVPNDPAPGR